MKKVYGIYADCANCAAKMEAAAKKVDGVEDVSVSFMTLKMTVTYADGVDVEKTAKQIRKACRRVDADSEVFLDD